jgi:hypothetical protein
MKFTLSPGLAASAGVIAVTPARVEALFRSAFGVRCLLIQTTNRLLNYEHDHDYEHEPLHPEPTGLEPATSAVTGQRSNQLS